MIQLKIRSLKNDGIHDVDASAGHGARQGIVSSAFTQGVAPRLPSKQVEASGTWPLPNAPVRSFSLVVSLFGVVVTSVLVHVHLAEKSELCVARCHCIIQ